MSLSWQGGYLPHHQCLGVQHQSLQVELYWASYQVSVVVNHGDWDHDGECWVLNVMIGCERLVRHRVVLLHDFRVVSYELDQLKRVHWHS